MSSKDAHYICGLLELPFMHAHQDILRHAQKMSNPRVAGIVHVYADCLNDLKQYVRETPVQTNTELNASRIAAYNVCLKAVQSLDEFGEHGKTVKDLYRAFGYSLYRLSAADVARNLDDAEKIAGEISKEELDAFSLYDRVKNFLDFSRLYHESCAAMEHNRSIRNKPEHVQARNNCTILYRCIMRLAKSMAALGDAECKEFIAWAESK